MGCASSTTTFTETMAVSGVVDLALVRGFTDADAAEFARAVERVAPITLRVPRFPCPDAKLTGAGLSQLFVAGAGSLTTVELNEAALPRVTAEAAAQALGFLGDIREVSIRGGSWPRRVLALLAKHETMPLSSVRSVLLGGAGVDEAALSALPKAFPCCQKLYLQNPDGVVCWLTMANSLAAHSVNFTEVSQVVFDMREHLPTAAVKAVEALCPVMKATHRLHPNADTTMVHQTAQALPLQGSSKSFSSSSNPQHLRSPQDLDSLFRMPPGTDVHGVTPGGPMVNPLSFVGPLESFLPTSNSSVSSLCSQRRSASVSRLQAASFASTDDRSQRSGTSRRSDHRRPPYPHMHPEKSRTAACLKRRPPHSTFHTNQVVPSAPGRFSPRSGGPTTACATPGGPAEQTAAQRPMSSRSSGQGTVMTGPSCSPSSVTLMSESGGTHSSHPAGSPQREPAPLTGFTRARIRTVPGLRGIVSLPRPAAVATRAEF